MKITNLTPPLETSEVSTTSELSDGLTPLTQLTVPTVSEEVSDDGQPFALYRFFAADGTLLYIGQTMDPPIRWGAHGQTKTWWPEVVRIEVSRFATRADAESAEATAVRAEGPIHNVVHAGRVRSAWNPSTPVRPVAQRILKWLSTRAQTEFTVRDALQALKGGSGGAIRTRADLVPHLDAMEAGGLIYRLPTERSNSVRYALVGANTPPKPL